MEAIEVRAMSADMGSTTSLMQAKSASSLNTAASGNSAGAEGLMALFNEASEGQAGEGASTGAEGVGQGGGGDVVAVAFRRVRQPHIL